MKVLFTGMTSSHCKPSENVGFFNTLAEVVSGSALVEWSAPKLTWTKAELESYDAIFLGFVPPTALSANKIYGAMHVLGLMFDSPKLNLVVDGGQIWQYKNSIEAVKRDVSILFSSFYSKRSDYAKARDPKFIKNIVTAAEKMSNGVWPKVIFPSLPWTTPGCAFEKLSFGSAGASLGLNLDSFLLSQDAYDHSRNPVWAVDNIKSSWYQTVAGGTALPGVSTKTSRLNEDSSALAVIKSSTGLLVAPQDRNLGSWWTYKYVQGLNSGTPIATYWQDTANFDPSWAVLPYQIEDLSDLSRRSLARDQHESYQASIMPKMELISYVRSEVLDSTEERI